MDPYRRYVGIVLILWLPVALIGWVWAWAKVPWVGFAYLLAIVVATLPPTLGTQWLMGGALRPGRSRRLVAIAMAGAISIAWVSGLIAAASAASIFSPDPPMTLGRFVWGVIVFGLATTAIVARSLRLTTGALS
jgi:hypothetical protein